jgi:Flp pilus assembly protein TadD
VPYLTLGKLQLAQAKSHSEIEAAQQNLEKSALLQPGVPTVYLLLGRAFGAEGQWADALTAVRHADEIAPNDPHTLFELARVYRQLGKTLEAERVTQRYRQVRIAGPPAV